MRAEERELAAARMRQVAGEVGLELGDEKLQRWVGLLETTVDGVRKSAAELGLDDAPPAFAATIAREDA